MPIVMKFGLLPPTMNADAVEHQIRLAHVYRNKLVELERDRRRMIREVEGAEIRAWEGEAKAAGIRKDEQAKRIARERLKELRQSPALLARMSEINGDKPKRDRSDGAGRASARNADKTPNNGIAAKARRAARAASGLFWGTYLCVEDAAGRSFADTGSLYDGAEDNDPRWHRFSGEGTLGVQIQSTNPLESIFGDDNRVSIAPVDEIALTSPIRSERRKAARTTLRMIVDGDLRSKRNPTAVYAEWPMLLHRPIPADARISWVKVSKRMVGPRAVWSCEITLERTKPPPKMPSAGTLAVVFGWRSVEGNKIRVAQWLSTTGETGVLDLSRDGVDVTECDGGRGGIISGFRRVESLASTRKTNFNAARNALVAWLRTLPEVPEWIRARTSRDAVPSSPQAIAYLSQWKTPGKLAGLVKAWPAKQEGLLDTMEVETAAEAWRYHDYHLWQWEESQRKGAGRRRNNVYRVTASRLAGRYSRILADGSNFKAMREREESEVPRGQRDNAQSMAQIVSPGILRDSFKNAALQRGRQFEKVEVGKTAQRCPRCGVSDKAHKHDDDGMFACGSCGLARDIAVVRLMNMLVDDGHREEVLEIIRRQDDVVAQLKAVV